MKTVLDIVPEGADVSVVTQRIASAYGALFSGNGGKDDASLVLIDLAQFARYYDTASFNMPVEQIAAFNHRRAVFQRIMDAMTLTGNEPNGLHSAVLRSPEPDSAEEAQ
jgi:hypothetical protein